MKKELEITVRINCSYEELHKKLLDYNFVIKEEYELNDDYMIDSSINIDELNKLDILKKCVLVRNIVGIKKVLLYKYKKYADNGDILEQGKVECPIDNIEKAISFMEAINYKRLIKIYDKCIVYVNDNTELVVQLVNDKYVFIEMESDNHYLGRNYNDIKEMIKNIEQYDLSYSKDSYYVKKAEIILDEVLKKDNK